MMGKLGYEERLYGMVKQFTTQDLKGLINLKPDAAGLLLMPVFAGMIALGRVLYGFDLPERDVFLKFARYRMRLGVKLAEVLYDNVRAGLITQWCSRSHVSIVCGYSTSEHFKEIAFRSIRDKIVGINVVTLAELYIKAVDQLPEYSKTQQHKSDEAFNDLRTQVIELRADLDCMGSIRGNDQWEE